MSADPQLPTMILRATVSQCADAWLLLTEYYREADVSERDTPETLQRFLTDPNTGFWIAFAGDTPAGCVLLRPLPAFGSAAECKRLYVRPAFRRRGIAEALLSAMENFARISSFSWIYLDSKDDLPVAIDLYLRRGYKPCGRYNQNTQATVFLRKPLNSSFS